MLVWFVACGPKIDVGPVPVERWAAPVTVVTEAAPADDEIRLSAMVRAGSGFDPIGREGLAWLVAHTLADDDLETVVDTEWVTFTSACPAPEAPRCIDRFVGALTTFDPLGWEEHREQALAQPSTALDILHQVLFEGHRTGHPRPGWPSVVPSLTPDEGQRFHATHYRRSTVLAGVVGSEAVASTLREALAAVPGGAPADDAWMRPPSQAGRRLFVVPREPEAPAEVVFGQVMSIGADDPAVAGLATAMAGLEAALATADPDPPVLASATGWLTPRPETPRRSVALTGRLVPATPELTADALALAVTTLNQWTGTSRLPSSPPPDAAQRLARRMAAEILPVVPPSDEAPDVLMKRLVDPSEWQFVVVGDPGDVSALGFDAVVSAEP
ncbi:MAG: hypothetical protein AAF602_00755 [Myxococcota bacterium]